MEFIEPMLVYFRGEKAIAYYSIPVGILMLILAFLIWKVHWSNHLLQGLFYPLVIIGLAAIGLGIGIKVKSEKDIVRLTSAYEVNQQETLAEESKRMEKVNANWIRIKAVWAILLVIGVLIIFLVNRDMWTGVALGLLLFGTLGFVVDTIAEKRAVIYAQEVNRLLADWKN